VAQVKGDTLEHELLRTAQSSVVPLSNKLHLGIVGKVVKRFHRLRFQRSEAGALARLKGFEAIWLTNQWLVSRVSGAPGEAELNAHNYQVVREALEAKGVTHALVSRHPMRRHVLAIPETQWNKALEALADCAKNTALYGALPVRQRGSESLRDSVFAGGRDFASRAGGLKSLAVFTVGRSSPKERVLAGRYACVLQKWSEREDGQAWLAPAGNETAVYVGHDAFDHLVDTTDIFGGRESRFERSSEPYQGRVNFPIDLVYLWVDGNDPEWLKSREAYSDGDGPAVDGDGAWLFRDRNELLYSLRSVAKYAPWVRHIHLLTAGQTPRWLNTEFEGITLHSHADVFSDPEALPTFNSHAIGTQVHRIPGLSEHYLVMNDDVLFGATVEPEQFFTPTGQVRIKRSTIHAPLADRAVMNTIENARLNSAELIQGHYGVLPTQLFGHTPVPQIKSFAEELENQFPDAYASTARSRFRSSTDFETNSWLQLNALELSGRATPSYLGYGYFYLNQTSARLKLERALHGNRTHIICLNDGPNTDGIDYEAWLDEILSSAYPEPSPYEGNAPV